MKVTSLKGTRDFDPLQVCRRNFIIDNIKEVFCQFGFVPIQTPAMEHLDVLLGKYGTEGDQLVFKIINSGDFLSKCSSEDFTNGSRSVLPKITKKGLRYDLTVPFARYVVNHQHELYFPFKRYQIQPVWRADRPQKGRYQEFYQCDADVIGTESSICETEIIWMISEVFKKLGITDYQILINNRKLLAAIAEKLGMADHLQTLCVAIDKLDKIGQQKVLEELSDKGFSTASLEILQPILDLTKGTKDHWEFLKAYLVDIDSAQKGFEELQEIMDNLAALKLDKVPLKFDPLLARGLNYYTGPIFEVQILNSKVGSVSGGGRYDNLTEVFGLKGISGVGFSFGMDRLYDAMDELNLFPVLNANNTTVLIVNFGLEGHMERLQQLQLLRNYNINAELYPDATKPKKQLTYANKKQIPWVVFIGEHELQQQVALVKNMKNGTQEEVKLSQLPTYFDERARKLD